MLCAVLTGFFVIPLEVMNEGIDLCAAPTHQLFAKGLDAVEDAGEVQGQW